MSMGDLCMIENYDVFQILLQEQYGSKIFPVLEIFFPEYKEGRKTDPRESGAYGFPSSMSVTES